MAGVKILARAGIFWVKASIPAFADSFRSPEERVLENGFGEVSFKASSKSCPKPKAKRLARSIAIPAQELDPRDPSSNTRNR